MMSVVIINKTKRIIIKLAGEAKRIFPLAFAHGRMIGGGGRRRGSGDSEGRVGVVDNASLDVYEVGDVFVAVVEVVGGRG